MIRTMKGDLEWTQLRSDSTVDASQRVALQTNHPSNRLTRTFGKSSIHPHTNS